VRRADDGDQMIELVEIQDATGLDDTAVIVGVDALADDDYFDLLRRAR
jgi:hypothetical protein